MCGIVGVASKGVLSASMETLFKNLLFVDTLRGYHATGVTSVNTSTTNTIVSKAALSAPIFLRTPAMVDPVFNKTNRHNILIGHNRHATKGAKDKDENAHPFTHGDVVGVHNGSLVNQTLLDDHRNFEVDSNNVFYHLNKNGLKDTVTKLDGAFALVWYNKGDNTLNFIRNSERPFCIAKMRTGEYVWASEEGMLRFLVDRESNLAFDKTSTGEEAVFSLPKYVHAKIQFKDGVYGMGEPEFEAHDEPVFEKVWAGYGSNWGSYSRTRSTVTTPSATDYSRGQDVVFKKLFPHGSLSATTLQVSYLGTESFQMSNDWTSRIALFEHVKADGTVLRLHHYVYASAELINGLSNKDIGKKFFTKVQHVGVYSNTTPDRIKNEGLDCTLSMKDVSRLTSNPYMPSHNDVKPPADKMVLLLPAPQEDTIALANCSVPKLQFIQLVTESGGCCWQCSERMLGKAPSSAFMYTHFDHFNSEEVSFLLCSKACVKRVKSDMVSLDRAYEKSFGEIDA